MKTKFYIYLLNFFFFHATMCKIYYSSFLRNVSLRNRGCIQKGIWIFTKFPQHRCNFDVEKNSGVEGTIQPKINTGRGPVHMPASENRTMKPTPDQTMNFSRENNRLMQIHYSISGSLKVNRNLKKLHYSIVVIYFVDTKNENTPAIPSDYTHCKFWLFLNKNQQDKKRIGFYVCIFCKNLTVT